MYLFLIIALMSALQPLCGMSTWQIGWGGPLIVQRSQKAPVSIEVIYKMTTVNLSCMEKDLVDLVNKSLNEDKYRQSLEKIAKKVLMIEMPNDRIDVIRKIFSVFSNRDTIQKNGVQSLGKDRSYWFLHELYEYTISPNIDHDEISMKGQCERAVLFFNKLFANPTYLAADIDTDKKFKFVYEWILRQKERRESLRRQNVIVDFEKSKKQVQLPKSQLGQEKSEQEEIQKKSEQVQLPKGDLNQKKSEQVQLPKSQLGKPPRSFWEKYYFPTLPLAGIGLLFVGVHYSSSIRSYFSTAFVPNCQKFFSGRLRNISSLFTIFSRKSA